jgi:hypothetical protein
MNLDDLELELRKLPGIRWVAFGEVGERLLVQLHAMHVGSGVALEATRIAARHCDVPVAVEVVRWVASPESEAADFEHPTLRANGAAAVGAGPTPVSTPPSPFPPPSPPAPSPRPFPRPGAVPAPQILGVLTLPDTDEVEVQVGDDTTRTIGRAALSRGLIGATDATLAALRDGFTVELPVAPGWARTIETTNSGRPLVAVALSRLGGDPCYGLSSADNEMEAAARATLDALHRNLRVVRRADASYGRSPHLAQVPPPPAS